MTTRRGAIALRPAAGVSVQVLNGVWVTGLAHQVAGQVRAAGDVVGPDRRSAALGLAHLLHRRPPGRRRGVRGPLPGVHDGRAAPANLLPPVALHVVVRRDAQGLTSARPNRARRSRRVDAEPGLQGRAVAPSRRRRRGPSSGASSRAARWLGQLGGVERVDQRGPGPRSSAAPALRDRIRARSRRLIAGPPWRPGSCRPTGLTISRSAAAMAARAPPVVVPQLQQHRLPAPGPEALVDGVGHVLHLGRARPGTRGSRREGR